VIFQDFPGPGIFKKKPRLSRRRGNPDDRTPCSRHIFLQVGYPQFGY